MPRAFFVMKVKIIAEIIADVHVFPDDVLNSDTVGDYKSELDCNVGNDSMSYLVDHLPQNTDITILSAQPDDEGIEEYNQILNNWQQEYHERIKKYER